MELMKCESGTSKIERLNEDLAKVVTVLSSLDGSNVQSIKHTSRLGNFTSSSKKRPILVTLICSADVNCILSNIGKLDKQYSIRPYIQNYGREERRQ